MTHIYYHSADHDGHCSGAIAALYHEKNNLPYTLCPINFGDKIPDMTGQKVVMCDFSLQPDSLMFDAILRASSFIWIDHHISAINAFKSLNLPGIQNTNFSACELTWQYFFPNDPMPLGVKLLGAYDTWRHHEDKRILPYEYYLRAIETDPKIFDWKKQVFDCSSSDIDNQAYIGEFILAKEKNTWKRQLKNAFIKIIQGKKVICLNTQDGGSMIFGEQLKEVDYAITFYRLGSGLYKNGFYSAEGKEDVSIIARTLGGGGHKNASGATTDDFVWNILK